MTQTHPHDHTHAHFGEIARQTSSRLALALAITLAFVVIEAIAGYAANSLALLSDAGHNLTDVFALCLSWVAIRLSQRPSSARHTYGFHRAGILAALVNSLTLILMSLWIFYEAYQRLVSPPEVQPVLLVLVGALALAVNLGTALLIRRGSEQDLNLRAAFVHLMGDVFTTAGAILAGVVIFFTGWYWMDALVSILIGGLILWNAWKILRETVDILLESTPRDVDMAAAGGRHARRGGGARRARPARVEHQPEPAHALGAHRHRRPGDQRRGSFAARLERAARPPTTASPTPPCSSSAPTARRAAPTAGDYSRKNRSEPASLVQTCFSGDFFRAAIAVSAAASARAIAPGKYNPPTLKPSIKLPTSASMLRMISSARAPFQAAIPPPTSKALKASRISTETGSAAVRHGWLPLTVCAWLASPGEAELVVLVYDTRANASR